MRSAGLIAIALIGCDGHTAIPAPDALPRCTATFTGNFAETSSSPADCPTVTTSTLDFAV